MSPKTHPRRSRADRLLEAHEIARLIGVDAKRLNEATHGKIDAQTPKELLRIATRIGQIHSATVQTPRPRARPAIEDAQRLITTIRAAFATLDNPLVADQLRQLGRSPSRTVEQSLLDLDGHAAMIAAHPAVRPLFPADFEAHLAQARAALETARIRRVAYATERAAEACEMRALEERLRSLVSLVRTVLAVLARTTSKEARP